MSAISDRIMIELPRRFLEHPEALHMRRMRGAVWLYLALLARLPDDADTLEVAPKEFAGRMGLAEATIRSFLGHLHKHRYVEVRRLNGSYRVRVKGLALPARSAQVADGAADAAPSTPSRFFTVPKLERALGETGSHPALEAALAGHADPAIQQALAGALAVPAAEIRRSRTALFLYLLKHPRP